MLGKEAVKAIIEKGLSEVETLDIEGDGYHYELLVVSRVFEGKNTLSRQQMIYALLGDEIKAGNLHALTLKTLTPAEREKQHG